MAALRVHLTSPAGGQPHPHDGAGILATTGLSLSVAGSQAATDGAWSTWMLLGLGLVWGISQLAVPDPRPASGCRAASPPAPGDVSGERGDRRRTPALRVVGVRRPIVHSRRLPAAVVAGTPAPVGVRHGAAASAPPTVPSGGPTPRSRPALSRDAGAGRGTTPAPLPSGRATTRRDARLHAVPGPGGRPGHTTQETP